MWHLLEKISEQVGKYSTWLGQLWYLCVFVFRLIVVVTIGGAVYGDEQSAFKCSTDEPGCSNMCYNAFSKISHMRFWAFQLLAVATPSVLFHFYSMGVTGRIEKLKKEQAALDAAAEDDVDIVDNPQFKKMLRRKKSLGNYKTKRVYSGGDLKEVYYTRTIYYAYYASVIVRLTLEAVFIYFAHSLFRFEEGVAPNSTKEAGAFDFLWFNVPAMYLCKGINSEAALACRQALSYPGGFVPCWVSRPWEKTVFVRYMSVMSGICFLLCAIELVYLTVKAAVGKQRKRTPRFFRKNLKPRPHPDSVFYAGERNGRHLDYRDFRPTLSVPIKLSKYGNTNGRTVEGKKFRISDDDDEVLSEAYLGSMASIKR